MFINTNRNFTLFVFLSLCGNPHEGHPWAIGFLKIFWPLGKAISCNFTNLSQDLDFESWTNFATILMELVQRCHTNPWHVWSRNHARLSKNDFLMHFFLPLWISELKVSCGIINKVKKNWNKDAVNHIFTTTINHVTEDGKDFLEKKRKMERIQIIERNYRRIYLWSYLGKSSTDDNSPWSLCASHALSWFDNLSIVKTWMLHFQKWPNLAVTSLPPFIPLKRSLATFLWMIIDLHKMYILDYFGYEGFVSHKSSSS